MKLMIPEQRRETIISKLKEKDIYSIDSLAKELNVSRITIQRDINILGQKGLVDKVHGGVKLRSETDGYFESRFQVRMRQNYEKKLEIAKKALSYVNDHSTIFLDSSTTIYIFATELFKKKFVDLNIITTSPAILCESLKYPDLKIISTGGELRSNFNMLGGGWVIDFLEKVNIDSAFVSAAGISTSREITTANRELANILGVVFKKSGEINLLVDGSKFFKAGMLNISLLDRCRRIITDGEIDKNIVSDLSEISSLEIIF